MNDVTIETERLGEKLEGDTEVLGMPVLIYGIDREEKRKES